MGGKSNMAGRLSQLLPEHTCYVEVFAGAANLLFKKQRSKTEVVNDINSDLVNLFRVITHHRREFIRQLTLMIHSRADFNDFKAQPGLTDIQRAARSWFILKTAFGGRGGHPDCTFGYGTIGKARLSRSAFAAVRRCHKRLNGVLVENLQFDDCIKRYDRPHTVFYCDRPYLETHGYRNPFGYDDHCRLAKQLKNIKGKFLLSINDHPDIRDLYRGFSTLKVQVKYSVSRVKSPKARDRSELVIANYPLPKKW